MKMNKLTKLQKFRQLAEVSCKSQSTINNYERYINKFTNRYGEHPKQEKILDYLHYLRMERKLEKTSVNQAKFALFYYYQEVLNEMVTERIPTIRRPKSVPKPVNKSIIKKLLDVAVNKKHKLLVEFGYDTGLRPFENVKLEWKWIDIENREGFVNKGKFDKDRPFYFSEKVARHLKEFGNDEFKGVKNKDRKYIFFSEARPDYHISIRTFQKIIKNLSKKADISLRMYPYRLRHSFCTHLQEDDIPIEQIRPRAGHESIKTTLGYTRVARPKGEIKSPMDNPIFDEKKEGVSYNC